MNESLLSVKNSSGRQVSLLNEYNNEINDWQQDNQQSKRKYHCIELGCNKSFTTSGHLARHNRIHTGEKNFPCLFPGCQSRFSRQDNMMQHYRTHLSSKSRRSQKRGFVEDIRPKPELHAHQRIRSDPVRVEPPLTIDQHLSNYHESLKEGRYRYGFPIPLSSNAKSPTQFIKNSSSSQHTTTSNTTATTSFSPTFSPTSSTASLPSFNFVLNSKYKNQQDDLFYQHQPLKWTKPSNKSLPYTLLHPTQKREQKIQKEKGVEIKSSDTNNEENPIDQDNSNNNKSATSGSLLQLAHIVSTLG